ncbi:FecCD family ABC transporter permease [Actinocorallia sp. A-T 12471]|uniref:FecCD family ABC transporter permease n=1 Tax=Actinocorallia sp. A-T 12471 TaxID=3089813 RepID=UPI0029D0994F|nr:iron chelate uptake ABC transporter family permease subunit [Actinocorallia sp. A-T 12471]MDX6740063.1 iron chelate uptake ABC transporter family permease subunit [Actinocorallia sp. A-T 12471]
MRRRTLGLALLLVLLAVISVLSLAVGAKPIPLADVWHVLLHRDGTDDSIVVWERRIPRTLLGIAVGAALGLAGALMQALSRNPLADPGLLGVNAGAAAAVGAAGLFWPLTSTETTVWFAFLGAGIAATLVYTLGRGGMTGKANPVQLILAGMAVTAVLASFTAATSLIDTDSADRLRFWVVGSLAVAQPGELQLILPFLLAGAVVGLAISGRMDALALGDDAGRALGTHPERTRALAIIAITVLCGAATSVAGPITFIGLMVPHAVRLFTGPNQRWILPLSMLCAPVILLASDIVGRVAAPPGELEAGVVTAFLGAPVFIALVRRRGVVAQ